MIRITNLPEIAALALLLLCIALICQHANAATGPVQPNPIADWIVAGCVAGVAFGALQFMRHAHSEWRE